MKSALRVVLAVVAGMSLAFALVVALLLAWALVFNLSMLPYTMWFKIAMSAAFFVACLLGIRYGRRVPSSRAVRDAA